MRPAIILLILFSIMSCKNDQKDTNKQSVLDDTIKNKEELKVHRNKNWSFSFQFSDDLPIIKNPGHTGIFVI
ncbi:hypothetical protein [Gramella sp. KN1008]|uniref:hypothetical protein n=1 Tax=Gramella sp. KN1008 TaxID=2529298 RepID=UPI00103C18B4|nr:hypothetical protein [Gramella sp. KN1008]TBW26512.1 hypothetical protein EZJ28_13995 [Gramella sp. KN1008]